MRSITFVAVALLASVAGSASWALADPPGLLTVPFGQQQIKEKQQEWATYLDCKVADINSLDMKFVLIPPGEFMMGSPETEVGRDDGDKELLHKVRLTRPYYLAIYPVTVGQFQTFCKDANYRSDAEKNSNLGERWGADGRVSRRDRGGTPMDWGFAGQTSNHPVVNVSWNDAMAFCDWLSKKEGKNYCLPSEAQWEYACRAGTTTRFYNGDDADKLVEIANIADQALLKAYRNRRLAEKTNDGFALTAPVGSFRPNAFGLYDMLGNVQQWCGDYYDRHYYKEAREDDPYGPAMSDGRANRGGGFCFPAVANRCAYRSAARPTNCWLSLGFRLARESQ